MSVVGDFTIPAESFTLDQALSTVPEMAVEADRMASHSTMEVMPFLWATGGDVDRFRRALEDDPTVTNFTIAEETDDEVLYRIEWSDEFCELINDMVDHHASISEASARDDQWNLRLRFAEEEMVSSFQDHFREEGRQFQVERLRRPSEPREREFGLTPEQHEALVAAVDEGYFSIPRTTSVEELGESLDISANAVSQRVRRGCETLIRSGLTITDDTE